MNQVRQILVGNEWREFQAESICVGRLIEGN